MISIFFFNNFYKNIDFKFEIIYNNNMKKKIQDNFLTKEEAKKFDEETLKSSTEEIKKDVELGEVETFGDVTADIEKTKSEENKNNEELEVSFEDVLKEFEIYSDMENMLRSSLLGYFEGDKYKIKKEIADDLLKLPKVIDEETLGKIVCHTNYKDYTFKFLITYDNFTTYSSARIYLLEDEDRVDEVITHKTLIGESVRPGGKNIADELVFEWNLKKGKNDGDGEDGGDPAMEITELDAALLGIKTDYLFNRELMEVLSQIYILRLTNLLKNSGEEGEMILTEYNKLLREYAIKRPIILQKYVMMKHLFDRVIKKNNGIEILKQKNEKELKDALEDFYRPLRKINTRYVDGKEVEFPSIERIKGTPQIEKPAPKKIVEKGEKPFYIKSAKAAKIDPYKFGKPVEGASIKGGGVAKFTPPKVESKPKPKEDVSDKTTVEKPPEKRKETEEERKAAAEEAFDAAELFDSRATANTFEAGETLSAAESRDVGRSDRSKEVTHGL